MKRSFAKRSNSSQLTVEIGFLWPSNVVQLDNQDWLFPWR